MRKKLQIIALLALAILLFVLVTRLFDKDEGSFVEIPNQQPIFSNNTDLDGDGEKETINLYITGNTIEGTTTILAVNSLVVQIPGHNPEKTFSVVDIDTADGVQEIAFTDDGPSGDFVTSFYAYKNNRLYEVAAIPGSVDDMTFLGNGTVSTVARGKILDTWFYVETFALTEQGILELVPKAFYPRLSTDPVILRTALSLSLEPTKTNETFMVPSGSQGTITGCDNISWCKSEFNGKTGWFEVNDFITITSLNLPANEVFEGLSNAD